MPDALVDELIAWATAQPDIRAMVLTSTRANGAPIDSYSDHDVILITTDVEDRYRQREWLRAFGDVVIDWWDPLMPDAETGLTTTGNVVYYPGTRKIDFTLWPVEMAALMVDGLNDELDAGYRVLLDKDDLTANWPDASGRAYAITLPKCERFQEAVNDFFIGVPYVATAMIRGEILPGKWVLDYDMRYEYLLPMLEWFAVAQHGTDVRIGTHGKGLHTLLPADVLEQLGATYAGMNVHDNLAALDAMVTLFRSVAMGVGEAIGCEYPQDVHDRVVNHTAALLRNAGLR